MRHVEDQLKEVGKQGDDSESTTFETELRYLLFTVTIFIQNYWLKFYHTFLCLNSLIFIEIVAPLCSGFSQEC